MGDKKQQTKRRRGYIRFIILIIFMAIIARIVTGLRNKAPDTALVAYGDIMIAERTTGIIVRDEKVIRAPISGDVTYIVKENIRVPVNTRLFEIRDSKIDGALVDKYNRTKERLATLQTPGDEHTLSEERDGTIDDVLSNIAFLIDSGNLTMVYYEKERLSRRINYNIASDPVQVEKQQLTRKEEELSALIEGGIKYANAPFAGVPVYSLDGYEEVLCPDNISEIVPSEVAGAKAKTINFSKGLKAGDPVMKIVNNHLWYLVCSLNIDFVKDLKEGSVVTLDIAGEESSNIRARVENITPQDDGTDDTIVTFQSRDFFPALYEGRSVDLTVVKGKYSGLVVPLSAITKKDGMYMVEVLDADKTIEKGVVIKGHDDINAVVEKSESPPGIKMYDKVVLRKE